MGPSRRSAVPPFAVMDVLAAANARRAAGADVLVLCAGEPATGAPADVRRRAAELAAADGLGYTEAVGIPALREEIARHYGRWYDVEVDPRRIAVTTGSSGGFVLAFLAAFDPGDRVALARPGYPAYRNILRSLGCAVVELDTGPEVRYQPTPELLAAAHAEAPLAGLVLASPANPTGTMVSPAELTAIADWCAEHGVRLVSDEIYHGISFAGIQAATAADQVGAIAVSSFSKYWGMTGWRLGWLVLPDDLVDAVDALAGNLALCPPALAQHAALEAFTPGSYAAGAAAVATYAASRDLLLARLGDLRWDPVAPADGAFYLYGDISATGLDAVTYRSRLLGEAGVALTPGTDFDGAAGHDWVRLSFAAEPGVVADAIERIVAWQDAATTRR
ncbi:aminotransferase class I and II [Beutenbergia cavernae DSM 12333]|uniref:Aminotransferase n=1 Tax=Beutenbergia cavernae (strain ATCC BAA-8 / DSM 12333 / CCUG 43141 / JCM 11478 / NBRC 16432 / NCIMB 13614 / HKI 0122) TaxID=471853 RepID=C5C5S0_BEUC1|nr:aminotransferase class I/II-fold pyridoxal phosphate-dependent enzyme [Beutenbergia cavernae]ACQ80261.1 aminotransferase class I and II [Beutenbergia cavernae DSM 12333]